MRATKVDYKRELRRLYSPGVRPEVVEVPDLRFLMLDGRGDPNSAPEYREALAALYSLAYAIKFSFRRTSDGFDFGVMPLEGLWRAPETATFAGADKAAWTWTMMILQPPEIGHELFEEAVATVRAKKALEAVARVRLDSFEEGLAAQVLHRGRYADEAPTIASLHAFIAEQGGTLTGCHHEIYLNDPTRTAPDRLRTIVRQPFQPAG